MHDDIYEKEFSSDKRNSQAGFDERERLDTYENWESYLSKTFKFPFEAKISAYQESGPLQEGDNITVLSISGEEDLYGILVRITKNRKQYIFPLCDIEVANKKSENYLMIDDYCHWFANYR